MKPAHPIYRLLLVIILLVECLSAAACGGAAPTAQPTQASPETALPTATSTLTPTLTRTPSLAPTTRPSATPKPSATPEGLFRHADAGFSLVFPTNWKVDKQENNQLVLVGPNSLAMYIISNPATEAENFDKIVGEWEKSDKDTSVKRQDKGQTTIGGRSAPYIDLMVTRQGVSLTERFIYVFSNRRSYIVSIVALPDELANRSLTVERVLASFQFFIPNANSMPADQSLTLLGGEPDVEEMDPALTTSSMGDYVGLIYATLVRLTPEMQLAGDLAEKWSVSPDGKVYTFSLRPNLKFSSGAALTANEVAGSWERACDPETGSTTARTYLGDIVGCIAKLDKKAKTVDGLKVIDDLTLQVSLDAPKAYFLAKLTYPTAAVVNPKKVQVKQDFWVFNPDASGPYIIREHRENRSFIFERNPNYYKQPAVPYITFLLSSGGTAIGMYEDNTIDILGVGSTSWKRVTNPTDPLNKELITTTSMCTTVMRLDSNRAPFEDANVRKAFSLAFNRGEYLEQLNQEANLLPANGILPPAMPGYLDERSETLFDPAAAKDLLAKSKYAGKLPAITLAAPGNADANPRYINLLVDMWQKNLGVKVQVQFLEPAKFTKLARQGSANLVVQNWCADYPDPENFLDILYHSKSDFNIGRTNKPELDQLLEKARVETESQKRILLYQQAETLLLNSNEVIPLNFSVSGVLVKPRVKGYVLSPLGIANIPLLSLEPTKP